MDKPNTKSKIQRRRILINGIVQGVGFRPFVYRLAKELTLTGKVANSSHGVQIEIEGELANLNLFITRLLGETPPLARISEHTIEEIAPINDTQFIIDLSHSGAEATTHIPPDISLCKDCLTELFDPDDRRYRYPFINCTNCGPRFTIIKAIPYDRPYTSMAPFEMCDACRAEYEDPANRRFHAQPIACAECGPKVWFHNGTQNIDLADPINETVKQLKLGKIVAIRGLGGFHLAIDANNEEAIVKLRQRKRREEKPLALMASDIEFIKQHTIVTPAEEAMLLDPIRPIVILPSRPDHTLNRSISFDNQNIGFMLPYTPIHELIIRNNFEALVMTSGNLTDEPIAIGNEEAIRKLSEIADFFLLHNREILQRCDDSIVRITGKIARPLRRARGYVPVPVRIPATCDKSILAVGAELKNTIALSRGDQVFFGQHIGDLDNPKSLDFFGETINHLQNTLMIKPEFVACDMHPEYLSTRWAKEQNKLPVIEVQHHHAHFASVLSENECDKKAIGLILDGTGYGPDETIWGGEVLVGNAQSFERFAWLDPVPMPGGTMAIRQPWRMGLSYQLLAEPGISSEDLVGLPANLPDNELENLTKMITHQINSPITSSCGRLFDGVAAMIEIKSHIAYEAQAAIMLETEAGLSTKQYSLDNINEVCPENSEGRLRMDKLINKIREMVSENQPKADIALFFHHALAEILINSARLAREQHNTDIIALSGGVFQNRLFFEYICMKLTKLGFKVLSHRQVPTNDGGLALGQIAVAQAQYEQQLQG